MPDSRPDPRPDEAGPVSDAEIKRRSRASFSARVDGYTVARTTADSLGAELPQAVALAGPPQGRAADVGTGGGAMARALAAAGWSVLLLDLARPMLREARAALAGEPAGPASGALQADAEALPLRAASLGLVAARNTAHHFPAPERFFAEVARVLRPGGRLVLVDLAGHERADFNAHLQGWERRRDPSHAASLSLTGWQAAIRAGGLWVEQTLPHRYRLDFPAWTQRQGMARADAAALAAEMLHAPVDVRDYFEIRERGGEVTSFTVDVALIAARRPRAD